VAAVGTAAVGMEAIGAAVIGTMVGGGPAVAAGVLTGATIASYPYWGDGGYSYSSGGCWQVRPTYDAYGNFLRQQSVNVC
jgi:hypothetical protein